jgi:hypothetical protein
LQNQDTCGHLRTSGRASGFVDFLAAQSQAGPECKLKQSISGSSGPSRWAMFSETGYRSFMGGQGDLVSGLTPDEFAREVIAAHIKGECKGKLRPVKEEYRVRY